MTMRPHAAPWTYFQGAICYGYQDEREMLVNLEGSRANVADARLMAAAPDLLAACELMVLQVPILADAFRFHLPACVKDAREAVNKAKDAS